MDSFKKLFKNKLPGRSKFFSSLKDKCISGKDYFKSVDVWNVLKMNTIILNTINEYKDFYY